MRIGLVRHFKVNTKDKIDLITSKEYTENMTEYDTLDVTPCEVDLRGIDWNKCYASNLSRAITTAETIYDGDIVVDESIKEVDLRLREDIQGDYSQFDWTFYSIYGWSQNMTYVNEGIDETKKRVESFLDKMLKDREKEDNILLVCHGMVMRVLAEELENRGFDGEVIVSPNNGDLYLFEK